MPPSWTAINRRVLPSRDQWVAISTTESPVTLIALVAVNRACGIGVNSPVELEMGRLSRIVNSRMSAEKTRIANCAGESCRED